MTTPVDLDHLEKLHAEATQGEWRAEPGLLAVHTIGDWTPSVVVKLDRTSDTGSDCDLEYIAATHNALPAIIAEVRLARAELHVSRRNTRESEWAIENANRGLQENSVRIVALEKERNHYQHEAEVEFAERKRIAAASDRAIIAATEKTLEHLEAHMRAETQRDEAMAIADRWKSQAELATTVGDITVRNSTDATKLEALHAEVRALRDAAEAARDYVENYGGDNENDRTRRRALAAALARVPR